MDVQRFSLVFLNYLYVTTSYLALLFSMLLIKEVVWKSAICLILKELQMSMFLQNVYFLKKKDIPDGEDYKKTL